MKDEERDDQGVQISPPGFNLIFIPFASDFRNLTIAETTKGTTNYVVCPIIYVTGPAKINHVSTNYT